MKKFLTYLPSKCIFYIRFFTIFTICITLLLNCTTVKYSALTYLKTITTNKTTTLHYYNDTVCITSYNNDKYTLTYLNGNRCNTKTIVANGKILDITISNGWVYSLCENSGKFMLNSYSIEDDSTYNYYLDNLTLGKKFIFSICNYRIYIMELDKIGTSSEKRILCYNFNGEKQYSFINNNFTYISPYNNSLYIFTQNKIYNDNNGNLELVQDLQDTILTPNIYITDNVLCDYYGNLLTTNNTKIKTNISCNKINAGVINGYYCRYSDGIIYGYNTNGDVFPLYKFDFNGSAQLCSNNNSLYLLFESGEFVKLKASNLNFPINSTEKPTKISTKPPKPNKPTQTTKPTVNSNPTAPNISNNGNEITSNIYKIDKNRNIIWNIPSQTTIAKLKSNIAFGNCTLKFYTQKNIYSSSGLVGTGYIMEVTDSKGAYKSYKLSVKGDLSGNGKINPEDYKILGNYLMDNYTLTQPQYIASDVNSDGIINGIDILKIAKNNL